MRTSRVRPTLPAAARPALLAALGFLLAGCFNPFRPEVSTDRPGTTTSGQPPRATSSRNVMKLFKWCWEHQNIALYDEIFTDNFRFAFAEADSEGNQFPGHELQRLDEIESARHLFVGGAAGEPPANSISIDFSRLKPEVDTRPGKTAPSHVAFPIIVNITIRTDVQVFRIYSNAVFYVVRGDSADVPRIHEHIAEQDRKRYWYIERYEETGQAALVIRPIDTWRAGRDPNRVGASPPAVPHTWPVPGVDVTWGWIKSRFR